MLISTKLIEAQFLLEKFFKQQFSFSLQFCVYFLGTNNTLRQLATIAGDLE